MEAAAVTPDRVKTKHVDLGRAGVIIAAVGGVVALVGVFLQGFKVPNGVTYSGSTSFEASAGGKIALASVIIGLVFLALAANRHRKGVLWGTYIFALIAIAVSAIDAGNGFTLTGAGSDIHADTGIGPIVATVGGVVLLLGALIARTTAQPRTVQ
jgi:hypothetical protein